MPGPLGVDIMLQAGLTFIVAVCNYVVLQIPDSVNDAFVGIVETLNLIEKKPENFYTPVVNSTTTSTTSFTSLTPITAIPRTITAVHSYLMPPPTSAQREWQAPRFERVWTGTDEFNFILWSCFFVLLGFLCGWVLSKAISARRSGRTNVAGMPPDGATNFGQGQQNISNAIAQLFQTLVSKQELHSTQLQMLLAQQEAGNTQLHDVESRQQAQSNLLQELGTQKQAQNSLLQDVLAQQQAQSALLQNVVAQQQDQSTQLDSIERKVDSVDGKVDASIQQVNDQQHNGTGNIAADEQQLDAAIAQPEVPVFPTTKKSSTTALPLVANTNGHETCLKSPGTCHECPVYPGEVHHVCSGPSGTVALAIHLANHTLLMKDIAADTSEITGRSDREEVRNRKDINHLSHEVMVLLSKKASYKQIEKTQYRAIAAIRKEMKRVLARSQAPTRKEAKKVFEEFNLEWPSSSSSSTAPSEDSDSSDDTGYQVTVKTDFPGDGEISTSSKPTQRGGRSGRKRHSGRAPKSNPGTEFTSADGQPPLKVTAGPAKVNDSEAPVEPNDSTETEDVELRVDLDTVIQNNVKLHQLVNSNLNRSIALQGNMSAEVPEAQREQVDRLVAEAQAADTTKSKDVDAELEKADTLASQITSMESIMEAPRAQLEDQKAGELVPSTAGGEVKRLSDEARLRGHASRRRADEKESAVEKKQRDQLDNAFAELDDIIKGKSLQGLMSQLEDFPTSEDDAQTTITEIRALYAQYRSNMSGDNADGQMVPASLPSVHRFELGPELENQQEALSGQQTKVKGMVTRLQDMLQRIEEAKDHIRQIGETQKEYAKCKHDLDDTRHRVDNAPQCENPEHRAALSRMKSVFSSLMNQFDQLPPLHEELAAKEDGNRSAIRQSADALTRANAEPTEVLSIIRDIVKARDSFERKELAQAVHHLLVCFGEMRVAQEALELEVQMLDGVDEIGNCTNEAHQILIDQLRTEFSDLKDELKRLPALGGINSGKADEVLEFESNDSARAILTEQGWTLESFRQELNRLDNIFKSIADKIDVVSKHLAGCSMSGQPDGSSSESDQDDDDQEDKAEDVKKAEEAATKKAQDQEQAEIEKLEDECLNLDDLVDEAKSALSQIQDCPTEPEIRDRTDILREDIQDYMKSRPSHRAERIGGDLPKLQNAVQMYTEDIRAFARRAADLKKDSDRIHVELKRLDENFKKAERKFSQIPRNPKYALVCPNPEHLKRVEVIRNRLRDVSTTVAEKRYELGHRLAEQVKSLVILNKAGVEGQKELNAAMLHSPDCEAMIVGAFARLDDEIKAIAAVTDTVRDCDPQTELGQDIANHRHQVADFRTNLPSERRSQQDESVEQQLKLFGALKNRIIALMADTGKAKFLSDEYNDWDELLEVQKRYTEMRGLLEESKAKFKKCDSETQKCGNQEHQKIFREAVQASTPIGIRAAKLPILYVGPQPADDDEGFVRSISSTLRAGNMWAEDFSQAVQEVVAAILAFDEKRLSVVLLHLPGCFESVKESGTRIELGDDDEAEDIETIRELYVDLINDLRAADQRLKNIEDCPGPDHRERISKMRVDFEQLQQEILRLTKLQEVENTSEDVHHPDGVADDFARQQIESAGLTPLKYQEQILNLSDQLTKFDKSHVARVTAHLQTCPMSMIRPSSDGKHPKGNQGPDQPPQLPRKKDDDVKEPRKDGGASNSTNDDVPGQVKPEQGGTESEDKPSEGPAEQSPSAHHIQQLAKQERKAAEKNSRTEEVAAAKGRIAEKMSACQTITAGLIPCALSDQGHQRNIDAALEAVSKLLSFAEALVEPDVDDVQDVKKFLYEAKGFVNDTDNLVLSARLIAAQRDCHSCQAQAEALVENRKAAERKAEQDAKDQRRQDAMNAKETARITRLKEEDRRQTMANAESLAQVSRPLGPLPDGPPPTVVSQAFRDALAKHFQSSGIGMQIDTQVAALLKRNAPVAHGVQQQSVPARMEDVEMDDDSKSDEDMVDVNVAVEKPLPLKVRPPIVLPDQSAPQHKVLIPEDTEVNMDDDQPPAMPPKAPKVPKVVEQTVPPLNAPFSFEFPVQVPAPPPNLPRLSEQTAPALNAPFSFQFPVHSPAPQPGTHQPQPPVFRPVTPPLRPVPTLPKTPIVQTRQEATSPPGSHRTVDSDMSSNVPPTPPRQIPHPPPDAPIVHGAITDFFMHVMRTEGVGSSSLTNYNPNDPAFRTALAIVLAEQKHERIQETTLREAAEARTRIDLYKSRLHRNLLKHHPRADFGIPNNAEGQTAKEEFATERAGVEEIKAQMYRNVASNKPFWDGLDALDPDYMRAKVEMEFRDRVEQIKRAWERHQMTGGEKPDPARDKGALNEEHEVAKREFGDWLQQYQGFVSKIRKNHCDGLDALTGLDSSDKDVQRAFQEVATAPQRKVAKPKSLAASSKISRDNSMAALTPKPAPSTPLPGAFGAGLVGNSKDVGDSTTGQPKSAEELAAQFEQMKKENAKLQKTGAEKFKPKKDTQAKDPEYSIVYDDKGLKEHQDRVKKHLQEKDLKEKLAATGLLDLELLKKHAAEEMLNPITTPREEFTASSDSSSLLSDADDPSPPRRRFPSPPGSDFYTSEEKKDDSPSQTSSQDQDYRWKPQRPDAALLAQQRNRHPAQLTYAASDSSSPGACGPQEYPTTSGIPGLNESPPGTTSSIHSNTLNNTGDNDNDSHPAGSSETQHEATVDEQDQYAEHMASFLEHGIDPPEAWRDDILQHQHLFQAENGFLFRMENGNRLCYQDVPYREQFLELRYADYGHLGYPGMLEAIKTDAWGWWPTMDRDVEAFIESKEAHEEKGEDIEGDQGTNVFRDDRGKIVVVDPALLEGEDTNMV